MNSHNKAMVEQMTIDGLSESVRVLIDRVGLNAARPLIRGFEEKIENALIEDHADQQWRELVGILCETEFNGKGDALKKRALELADVLQVDISLVYR